MNAMIHLDWVDLAIAAVLVIALGVLSWRERLALEKQLLIGSLRTVVQLTLVGLVLKVLFAADHPLWVAAMSLVMLAAAGWEVVSRQKRRLVGAWGYGLGTSAMFVSSFSVTIFALLAIIGNHPWYAPQYAIPLLGMMLGNTMSGIALALDRLTNNAWQQRAISDIQREAVRAGMIPTINAMASVGVVSLPGMMTGQILAGALPVEAVKYQILIMFMLAAGTGFGVILATRFAARRLFDTRERLRLDRLT
jgi:putative ABC transport system permease protein